MPKLTGTSSKAEEVKTLRQMQRRAGTGTFLASLFSERLIEWVIGRMRDDFSPDIMDEHDALRAEIDAIQARLSEAQQQVVQRDYVIGELEETFRGEAADQQRVIDALRLELATRDLQVKSLRGVVSDQQSQIVGLNQANEVWRRTVNEHRDEIMRLKAQLYDLLSPANVADNAKEQA